MRIDNGVVACSVLSDTALINATLGNDDNDDNDESDVEEVPLCLTVAEVLAALSVLEDSCFLENACPI